MVDRDQYRGPAALELLRRYFKGPQDLSFADGAGEATHVVWTAFGGHPARLYSLNWFRLLRPFQAASSLRDRTKGAWRWLGKVSVAVSAPGDLLLSRALGRVFRPAESNYCSKRVLADELFECIQESGWREPLKPHYELPSFRWLMSQAAAARSQGSLRMMIVYAPDGNRCGWYVYYAMRGRPAYVLQIGVRRRDHFDAVLLALFRDAWDQGASAVKGQTIPSYLTSLTSHHCLFRYPGSCVLVQTRNSDLLNTIRCGDAALSRLDGECWMRFAVEDWK